MTRLRTRPIEHKVTFTLDGEAIEAERGEPVAAALIAAKKITLARSPKFHRPRGPSCMRGACDGCLARVDGVPNVMTCLTPVEQAMSVVSQNRLGSREADVLRMTDWFFPEGMNHHELFAGVPGVQRIMQGFARRVAGLGKLPAEAQAMREAVRRSVDVLVVGGGPAGMAIASRLARAGRDVEVLDDALLPGGSSLALLGDDVASFDALRSAFREDVSGGKIRYRSRTTAGAVYGRDVLVVGDDGASILEARALILACGAHDGVLAFEGNDLPGVMSARAAGWLLAGGILVGSEIAVIVSDGGGPFGASFARAVSAHAKVHLLTGEPLSVRGTSRPRGIRVRTAKGEREVDADAIVIDAPRSPAYELCEQAGATLTHEPRGFVVRAERGRITEGIWATGEVCGVAFEAEALMAHAERVAEDVLG
jgi:sarcosine oxidase subunit alpha